MALAASALIVTACGQQDSSGTAAVPEVAEAFVTDGYPEANLDSMAVWRAPSGGGELLVTAKDTDVLLAFDAANGRLLRTIGEPGSALGQFRRPNGIAIEGDVVLIVERDNARVQVLALPGDRPLGTFGGNVLRRPYGLATFMEADGGIVVYVTDNYETSEGGIPPDEELGQRVHQFRVRVDGEGLDVTHVRVFGDTSGPGVLRKVETIAVDPAHDQVLVAEEHEAIREIKVYSLDGRFSGRVVPNDYFRHEPEGLALYPCGDAGYWVATDQHPEENVFHVLDRGSLAWRGSLRGAQTRQTDGIAVTKGTLGGLAGGALYAAHVDAHVSAFSWASVAAAVGLEGNGCGD